MVAPWIKRRRERAAAPAEEANLAEAAAAQAAADAQAAAEAQAADEKPKRRTRKPAKSEV